jgi:hypothetical protein
MVVKNPKFVSYENGHYHAGKDRSENGEKNRIRIQKTCLGHRFSKSGIPGNYSQADLDHDAQPIKERLQTKPCQERDTLRMADSCGDFERLKTEPCEAMTLDELKPTRGESLRRNMGKITGRSGSGHLFVDGMAPKFSKFFRLIINRDKPQLWQTKITSELYLLFKCRFGGIKGPKFIG